jgi:hypothetical protein
VSVAVVFSVSRTLPTVTVVIGACILMVRSVIVWRAVASLTCRLSNIADFVSSAANVGAEGPSAAVKV